MSMVRHQRYQRREPHIEGVTTVLVDPDGDLTLRTGSAVESEGTTNFRVCSSTLRRSSPVFKAMLFGGIWAESWKPSPSSGLEWTVSLPYDSPRDMQTLLHITHGNFDSVPSSPSTEELYRILVLADKYALSRKLGPWVSRWLKVTRDRSEEEIKTEERVWMMRIAWHLGDEKLYLMQLKDFILRACFVPAPEMPDSVDASESAVETKITKEEGSEKESRSEDINESRDEPVKEWLLCTEDDNCDLGLLLTAPEELDCGMSDLPEFIDSSRYQSLLEICVGFNEETFARIAPGKWKGHCVETSSPNGDGARTALMCDATLLASILEKWSEDEIWNLGPASKEDPARGNDRMPGRSVNSLMRWQISYSASFTYLPGHERCTPKHFFEHFQRSFRDDMGCWNSALREGERSHLEERRELFGITDDPELLVPVDPSPGKEEDGVDGPKQDAEWEDVQDGNEEVI
ncbi:hypothetical protein QBC41DRAFT_253463 [Cercophora samala]|uniref:BTB domain-containing protein n=1 Tax=Cercophora samala TaxID=330535 RepID=A0AA39ZCC4_9PEZI|nr:hypothetical protein QBC41DRAFT_253463 [Cercophora samala]